MYQIRRKKNMTNKRRTTTTKNSANTTHRTQSAVTAITLLSPHETNRSKWLSPINRIFNLSARTFLETSNYDLWCQFITPNCLYILYFTFICVDTVRMHKTTHDKSWSQYKQIYSYMSVPIHSYNLIRFK